MSNNTYCGKSCAECTKAAELNCSGCKTGPGRPVAGDCRIAICCREKGHERCGTCSFRSDCEMWRGKYKEPERRLEKRVSSEKRNIELAQKAVLPGKWLWVLFWLIIPSILAGILGNEALVSRWPGLYLPSEILSVACNLTYAFILLRLTASERLYMDAGGFLLASVVFSIISLVAQLCGADPVWGTVILIPSAILGLIGEYKEYAAHGNLVGDYDYELAAKWRTLYKWYIVMFVAMMASLVIMLALPIIGLIIMLAALIGTIVVSILKLDYLYKTAALLRRYAK